MKNSKGGLPPKIPEKPANVSVYEAIYPYTATRQDELSFQEGQILYVLNKDSDNWWTAQCDGKTGKVPSTYIQESAVELEAPLHDACKRGNTEFLKECLGKGLRVNSQDKSGSTALHWAAIGGHKDCMILLFQIGSVQVDIQNKLGDTPLHNAAWKGHYECVEMLLEKEATKSIINNSGKKPYDLAKDPKVQSLLMVRKVVNEDEYLIDTDDDDN